MRTVQSYICLCTIYQAFEKLSLLIRRWDLRMRSSCHCHITAWVCGAEALIHHHIQHDHQLIAWSKRPVAQFRNKSLSKASSGLVSEANRSFYYPLSSRQWVSLLAAFVVWMYGERVREACVQRNDPSIFTVFNVLGMGRMTEAIAINHDFRHEDI